MKTQEEMRGSINANAALGEEDVRNIRKMQGSVSAREVAKMYLVGVETIRRIWRRDTWAWLSDEAPLTHEPPAEALEASKAKLQALLKEQTPGETTADNLLEELAPTRTLEEEAALRRILGDKYVDRH